MNMTHGTGVIREHSLTGLPDDWPSNGKYYDQAGTMYMSWPDADGIQTGPHSHANVKYSPAKELVGQTEWTKITIYARKLLSVNDIKWNDGINDPSIDHAASLVSGATLFDEYDSGEIDLIYQETNDNRLADNVTRLRWKGNDGVEYMYRDLPKWIENKMPLWGTSNVTGNDNVPVVFRKNTQVIMMWFAETGSPQSEWIRTTDVAGNYFTNSSTVYIYTKTFEPGTYALDNKHCMYLFAPVYAESVNASLTHAVSN